MDPSKRWRNSISDVHCQAAALTFCAGVIHETLMRLHDDWWVCHSHIYAPTHTQVVDPRWKERTFHDLCGSFRFGVTVKTPSNSTTRTSCSSRPGDCYQDADKHKHTATQQTTQALPFGWSACCSKLHLSGIRATPSLTVATSVLRASCRHGNSPDQTFPQSRDISVGTFPWKRPSATRSEKDITARRFIIKL